MAKITKAESEANETAWNYMQRCEQQAARIAALEALIRDMDDANKHSVVKVGAWEQHSKLQERIDDAPAIRKNDAKTYFCAYSEECLNEVKRDGAVCSDHAYDAMLRRQRFENSAP